MEGITGSRWGNETEQNERTDERRKRKKGFYRLIRSRTIIVGRRTDTGRPLIHPIRSIVRSCAGSGRRRPRDAETESLSLYLSVCDPVRPPLPPASPFKLLGAAEETEWSAAGGRAQKRVLILALPRSPLRSLLRSFAPIFAYSAHLSDEMEAKKSWSPPSRPPPRPSAPPLTISFNLSSRGGGGGGN